MISGSLPARAYPISRNWPVDGFTVYSEIVPSTSSATYAKREVERVGSDATRSAVDAFTVSDCAVIVTRPRAPGVATPEPLIVAIALLDDVQVICLVTSSWEPSLNVPSA